jgi:hypothetical protein
MSIRSNTQNDYKREVTIFLRMSSCDFVSAQRFKKNAVCFSLIICKAYLTSRTKENFPCMMTEYEDQVFQGYYFKKLNKHLLVRPKCKFRRTRNNCFNMSVHICASVYTASFICFSPLVLYNTLFYWSI